MSKKLREMAYAVSGDKGMDANVGVIVYEQKNYTELLEQLTTERVSAFFKELHPKSVIRYELPNLGAVNFILEGVLEGGLRGLEVDAQGKTLGQQILEIEL